MLDNPADAARMAEAARSRIGEQFRSDLLGQELIETYETALRLGGKRSR
jgi:hypothetical protein